MTPPPNRDVQAQAGGMHRQKGGGSSLKSRNILSVAHSLL
jgi:hypothetical protein